MSPESLSIKSQAPAPNNACYQNPSSKIDSIRSSERISEMRDHLNGKSFSGTETVKFLYPDKSCMKQEVKFNISDQSIDIGGHRFKLTLPKGATITGISFNENGVKIDGKVAFFSGSWEAKYESLIKALDEVIQSGNAVIASSNGEITLSRYA